MKLSVPCLLANAAVVHSHPDQRPQTQYANHIFNSVHSSMRQFGSSMNHNGMSFFLATVPAGTEFYHGTSIPDRQNGTQWLAFEPEHAFNFARPHRGGPGGPGRGPPGGHGPGAPLPPPEKDESSDKPSRKHDRKPKPELKRDLQDPLDIMGPGKPDSNDDDADDFGYVHTYRTKHALRLIYLDGQSAAKSQRGTLDTQDLVLLHDNPPSAAASRRDSKRRGKDGDLAGGRARTEARASRHDDEDPTPHHGPMGEAERAIGVCDLAKNEWKGRIDGFLRMEGGFEIILCDFAKDLDVVRITQYQPSRGSGPPGLGDSGDHFDYWKAVAARYDGIGGDRVVVDYEDFVTMLAVPDAAYFDDTGRPRVDNTSDSGIATALTAIKNMVHREHKLSTINWQAIVDMVVTRYSDRLEVLTQPSVFDTLAEFTAEVDRALRPFVDFGARNSTLEVQRCAAQFLPAHTSHLAIHQTISNVTSVLCNTLHAASNADTLDHAQSLVRGLKSWLAWTTWKRCRGCAADQICFLPIWPMGSEQDFEHLQCVDRVGLSAKRGGYWGEFGPHSQHDEQEGEVEKKERDDYVEHQSRTTRSQSIASFDPGRIRMNMF